MAATALLVIHNFACPNPCFNLLHSTRQVVPTVLRGPFTYAPSNKEYAAVQFLTRNSNRQHFHHTMYHPFLSIFYCGSQKHFVVTMHFFLSTLFKGPCALVKKVCIRKKRLWRLLIHAQAKLFSPPRALSLALLFQLI